MQNTDTSMTAKMDQNDKPLSQCIQELQTAMQRVTDEDTFGRMSDCMIKCYDFELWRLS